MIVLVSGLPGSGKTTLAGALRVAPLIGPLGLGPSLAVDTSTPVIGRALEEV